MREIRLSGSVEGVMGNHDLYCDWGRVDGPHEIYTYLREYSSGLARWQSPSCGC
jgi:hypothetical protein